MMKLAPVALFVFKRLDHTAKTIEALQKNPLALETELIIFSDEASKEEERPLVNAVRKFINSIRGFKGIRIIERQKNLGLAKSIIEGVSSVLNEYQNIIVLEDDLITSRNFLLYMNKALDFYRDNAKIFSIAGYCPPIKICPNYIYDTYLIPTRSASWGWATWNYIWEKVDWEVKDYLSFIMDSAEQKKFDFLGKDMTKMLKAQMRKEIDSWSIRFDYYHFKHNAYAVYPTKSKIINIGMDATGTHSDETDEYIVPLDLDNKKEFNFSVVPDNKIIETASAFFNSFFTIKSRLKRKIKKFTSKLYNKRLFLLNEKIL